MLATRETDMEISRAIRTQKKTDTQAYLVILLESLLQPDPTSSGTSINECMLPN